MDAQGKITYRVVKDQEKKAIERIRKYLSQTVGSDDDAAVIRFCIKTTENELSRMKAKE
jgi:hypothetical protein